MKKTVVAGRFAKALIDIAAEENSLDRTGRELSTLYGVFSGNPDLYRILMNPMYALDERRAFMEEVSVATGAGKFVTRFMNILVETRNIKLLEEVVAAYRRFEDRRAGRVRAAVESPEELPGALLEEIKQKLSELTGHEIVLTHRKNPSLVGGLVVRMENTVIDGSIKTQLSVMRERILQGA